MRRELAINFRYVPPPEHQCFDTGENLSAALGINMLIRRIPSMPPVYAPQDSEFIMNRRALFIKSRETAVWPVLEQGSCLASQPS